MEFVGKDFLVPAGHFGEKWAHVAFGEKWGKTRYLCRITEYSAQHQEWKYTTVEDGTDIKITEKNLRKYLIPGPEGKENIGEDVFALDVIVLGGASDGNSSKRGTNLES